MSRSFEGELLPHTIRDIAFPHSAATHAVNPLFPKGKVIMPPGASE